MNYEPDYFALIFVMAMVIIGTISIVRNPNKINRQNSKKLIAGGISLVIIITILDSFIEHHSDFNYVISFICLKRVNVTHIGGDLRLLITISYIFIILGSLQLFFARSNKRE